VEGFLVAGVGRTPSAPPSFEKPALNRRTAAPAIRCDSGYEVLPGLIQRCQAKSDTFGGALRALGSAGLMSPTTMGPGPRTTA